MASAVRHDLIHEVYQVRVSVSLLLVLSESLNNLVDKVLELL
jgi:hypothetical protein